MERMNVSAGIQQANWAVVMMIGAASIVLNLPLGYAREGFRRFSLGWFVCVHLSIPLIAYLRLANHVSSWAIPAYVACALLGQVAGGRVRRGRQGR
jgi:ABC-type thiamin/hydroxymethylpyrimidine transport system permease subunit